MGRANVPNVNDQAYLDQLLDERAAAALLSYSARALQNWRLRGGGPLFVRVSSRSVRYRRRDLIEWIEGRLRHSTSQDAPTETARKRRAVPSA